MKRKFICYACILIFLGGIVKVAANNLPYKGGEGELENSVLKSDKKLLWEFLQGKIPIVNAEAIAGEIHASDSANVVYAEDISIQDKYYIVDMDGDGKNELCFYTLLNTYVIQYNEKEGVFHLWLSAGENYIPLENGMMYTQSDKMERHWLFVQYDENADVLKEDIYSIAWNYNEEIQQWEEDTYTIWEKVEGKQDSPIVEVSKEEWNNKIMPFFERIEDGPEVLRYEMLCDELEI